MTNIDQFESLFKKADKPRLVLEPVDLQNVLLIGDLDERDADRYLTQVYDLLEPTLLPAQPTIQKLCSKQTISVDAMVREVMERKPDMVCTYRNLYSPASDYPYSLGVYLDVLTQVTSVPILVLPSPHRDVALPSSTNTVMAITDHMTGDHHLVSYATRLTAPQGRLLLTHVEDKLIFDRYMRVIAKVPLIDTETAHDAIMQQLLQEPHDYIRSCAQVLEAANLPIEVKEIVTVGHSVLDYKHLVDQYQVDLLVLNTKENDQLAMHGVAYPLCVEMRDTPLLML